ncbi:hypothetical protein C2G38_2233172 [Gigaspora rosea]|uniref:Uncharacterized protein n=1 Tax=Gigaspora rosea TaxID=44941 RepID=A0A397TRG8_9GLOM|nr:hypothetical protein C2G38_2233172 [Gigaspora rosea]
MEDSTSFPEPILQPPLEDNRDKKKQKLDEPASLPTTTTMKIVAESSPKQTDRVSTVNAQLISHENPEPIQAKPASPQMDQQPKTEIEIESTHTNIPYTKNVNSKRSDPHNYNDHSIMQTATENNYHVEIDLDDACSDTTMSSVAS